MVLSVKLQKSRYIVRYNLSFDAYITVNAGYKQIAGK